ncbi:MAG: ATP-binding protein [Desulfovibrio sp.]|jgi:predicted AAA+ superfamily ATPase|nr:ATP-binding protein [Desulfovibrio sp.]
MQINELQDLLIDMQKNNLPLGIPRQISINEAPGMATTIIGVRRCGKSTLCRQISHRLLENEVPQENIVFLDFFDDRLWELLPAGNIGLLPDAYYSLFPMKRYAECVYFFFDEIQLVQRWEPFIDRLQRTENCKIYLTGSSAKLLSTEVSTEMRGRSLSWELFPISFREFLSWKGLQTTLPMAAKDKAHAMHAFDEYWNVGGFPRVLSSDAYMRIMIHQQYFESMILRDIVERHDISHPKALSNLMHRLVASIGSLYSVNKLTEYVKSIGYNVPKASISDYLEWIDDAFVLFTVRKYDESFSKSNVNSKKIYCIDHALARSICPKISKDDGHLLENVVFIGLRSMTKSVYYYRTSKLTEVDFFVQRRDLFPLLVQVCYTIEDTKTRRREVDALSQAMKEVGAPQGYLVTYSHEERIDTSAGVIAVMPAWRFLLEIASMLP